ncbi:S24 family peptidase [Alistipes finegoldii]|jgi:phage repressor protein C with HTH and peptisase S24 domain|uniref:S24 family peptidase n=1 Tax=uncultured Alistipes sp. TaxID=538949 RepID=UPI0020574D0D|nr:S24 family peptidase [uncultured Alistipes sp.]DAL54649.1 MAG TPA_asm: putative transcriptional regulator [Caudoviricetes sp.]
MNERTNFEYFISKNRLKKKDIAEYLGVSSAFITALCAGTRPIPSDKFDLIKSNTLWDTTMFSEEKVGVSTADKSIVEHNNIRYWIDVDATAGGVQQFDDMVTDKYISLSIPEFRDCTDAVNLYGDSMVPLYKSGQIIILKEWKESFIDFGNVYLVVTKSGNRMVKYLRKGSDAAHILCVSENKEFDPFEIEKTDILRLYLVKGGISKNTL